ncbi:MAG: histidine triad nucleotide-binding protein [Amphritea sp.]
MSNCLFCQIAAGEVNADIVYEDEQILAIRDIYPKAPVHLLVIPRKHVDNLYDLEDDDCHLMSHIMMYLPKIAKQQGLLSGFRTITNTGAGGRQEIYHMHFHLMGGGKLPPM